MCFSFSIVLSEREAYIVREYLDERITKTMLNILLVKLKIPVFFSFGTSYYNKNSFYLNIETHKPYCFGT